MKNIFDFYNSKKEVFLNNFEGAILKKYHFNREDIFFIEGIRREGKTYTGAIIILYEVYKLLKKGNSAKYYGIISEETITLIFKVINNEEKQKVSRLIESMLKKSKFLKNCLCYNIDRGFLFGGKSNFIRILISTYDEGEVCDSAILCVVLDDFDEDNVNHNEVFKSVYPCIQVFGRDGRIIKIKNSNS